MKCLGWCLESETLEGAEASQKGTPAAPMALAPSCWAEPLAKAAGHLFTWAEAPAGPRQLSCQCQHRKLR